MQARQLTQAAQQNPETWQSDGQHEDEVVYGNGMFTIGSQGDAQDFDSADKAAEALAYSWEQEDTRCTQ